jgi:hypothetical protein
MLSGALEMQGLKRRLVTGCLNKGPFYQACHVAMPELNWRVGINLPIGIRLAEAPRIVSNSIA